MHPGRRACGSRSPESSGKAEETEGATPKDTNPCAFCYVSATTTKCFSSSPDANLRRVGSINCMG